VRYLPLSSVGTLEPDTIAVSNNSVSSLAAASTRRRVVWAHLDLRLRRLANRGDLFAVYRIRPHLVVPSKYSAGRTQAIVPFRSRTIIEHGIDATFLHPAVSSEAPPQVGVFASQPGRNLDMVLAAWREHIRPRLPNARLRLYFPRSQMRAGLGSEQGVEIVGSVSKSELAKAYRGARVLIYPGHKEETFCNVAAEAIASGVPVATMGIGALAERVRDGVDGFVAPTVAGMAEAALQILTDDATWARLHRAGIDGSTARNWDARAVDWESAAGRWK
jgi:glycosyltransferase involved in cell wall biosynthesis